MTTGFDNLTNKQQRIVSLVLDGYTHKAVADMVGVSRQHIYQVYRGYKTGKIIKSGRCRGEVRTIYKDTGCEYSPTCQTCPFPDCIK